VRGGGEAADMTIARPPDPDLSWSFDLPVNLKCAIADCITLYSKIESCIVEIVWVLEEADLPRRIEIAKSWGDQNFKIVKRAVKSMPSADSDEIWPTLKELQTERNLIGHGVWMVTDDGRPLVVWHAKFLESADWVGAEYFDWRRFDHFLARGQVLLKAFTEFKALLSTAIAEEKAHRMATALKAEFASGNARPFHVATQAELGSFAPVPAECHSNAKRWVTEHPSYRVVEGWVAEDPEFLFVKHSVVADEVGRLLCVTLGPQGKSAPSGIVIHRPGWTPEQFAKLPAEVRVHPGSGTLHAVPDPHGEPE
jgi:hypothetical protein